MYEDLHSIPQVNTPKMKSSSRIAFFIGGGLIGLLFGAAGISIIAYSGITFSQNTDQQDSIPSAPVVTIPHREVTRIVSPTSAIATAPSMKDRSSSGDSNVYSIEYTVEYQPARLFSYTLNSVPDDRKIRLGDGTKSGFPLMPIHIIMDYYMTIKNGFVGYTSEDLADCENSERCRTGLLINIADRKTLSNTDDNAYYMTAGLLNGGGAILPGEENGTRHHVYLIPKHDVTFAIISEDKEIADEVYKSVSFVDNDFRNRSD